MPIISQCPSCQKQVQIADSALGMKVRCGFCQHIFVVQPMSDGPKSTSPPKASTPPKPAPPKAAPEEPKAATAKPPALPKSPAPPKSPASPKVTDQDTKAVTAKPPTPARKKASSALPPVVKSAASRSKENDDDDLPRRRPTRRSAPPVRSRPNYAIIGGVVAGSIFMLLIVTVLGWMLFGTGDRGTANNKQARNNHEEEQKKEVAPPKPAVQIVPPKLEQDKVVRPLPSSLDEIVVGGGGRFILLNLPQVRKIALFDANEAKIVHYFNVSGDNVKMAAGLEKLVMVFPDTNIIQRWDLLTREKEVTATIGGVTNIGQVVMGSASAGPILVASGGDQFRGDFAFLDLKTLKPLNVERIGHIDRSPGGNNLRASADGTVFGVWSNGLSPSGLQTLVLQGNRLRSYYQHDSVGHICPSPDGKLLYTGTGVYTSETRRLGAAGPRQGRFCVPALHGNFYLGIDFGDVFNRNPQPPRVNVHLAGDERSLITLKEFDLKWQNDDRFPFDRAFIGGIDKRILFIPDAKLIVTIPMTNNQVVVQHFDLDDAMENAGIDYLYVTSRPPTSAEPGRNYSYRIDVKSKKGGVKYRLDSGPKGMKLEQDGRLTWNIPGNFAEGDQDVIVTISDNAGQEVFHSFKIATGTQVARVDAVFPPNNEKFPEPPFVKKAPPSPVDFEDKKEKDPFPIDKKDPFPIDKNDPFEEKKDSGNAPVVGRTGQLPPLPTPLPIKPAPLEADTVTRMLPGTIGNVLPAGGGRFLIFHIPKMRQLAIFDVNEAKVVKYLPVTGDNPMLAAGMTKLIVAFADTKIVQRWNLLTYERELTTTLPINDGVAGIGMGYGSDGPLAVQTVREPISGELFFVDIRTMKQIDLKTQIFGHVHRGANARMRGSLDGRVFGISSGGQYPYIVELQSEAVRIREGAAIPGTDGKTLFGMGLFTSDMKPLSGTPNNFLHCVPALQGQFYLAIPNGFFRDDPRQKASGVELRLVGDNRPLLTLNDIETPSRDSIPNRDALALHQRYHFIPDAQVVVNIPTNGDRFLLRKLNLDDALDKSGIDYLFVTSTPLPYAVLAQDYTYSTQAKSKKGGLKFRVESGPKGMKVSPDGVVSWKVPADFQETQSDVIMTIGDSSGQEIFHTFKLAILKERPSDRHVVTIRPAEKDPAEKDPAEKEPALKQPEPKAEDTKRADAPPKNEPPIKRPNDVAPDPQPTAKAQFDWVGGPAFEIKRCPVNAEQEERPLPGIVRDIVLGGGGRFVILALADKQQIAIFDVNEAKVVKYLPIPEEDAILAAGMEKLFVCLPGANVVQRWSLRTFEREATVLAPVKGTLKAACMGWASYGPLLLISESQSQFVHPNTLQPLELRTANGPLQQRLGSDARPSGDGTVFTCMDYNRRVRVFTIRDGVVTQGSGNTSSFISAPGADGSFICTMIGVYTNEMIEVYPKTDQHGLIVSPFVASKQGRMFFRIGQGGHDGPKNFNFFLFGHDRPIGVMPNFVGFESQRNTYAEGAGRLSADRRYLLLPNAEVLVALPATNDRLLLRKFNTRELLDNSGINYLVVTSTPPRQAFRGQTYRYDLTVLAKKGEVKYKIESGPDGMQISPQGQLTWLVSENFAAADADVILTVSDVAGQQTFHTFRVFITDKANEP